MIKKIVGWLFPSVSEYEFIFFVTLLTSGVAALVAKYFDVFISFSTQEITQDPRFAFAYFLVLAILVGLIVQAVNLARNKRATINIQSRSSYVITPALIMLFFTSAATLFRLDQPVSLFGQIAGGIVAIRSFMILLVVEARKEYPERVDELLSQEFSDAQASKRGLLFVACLGVAGGVMALLATNWPLGIINAYLAGTIIIRLYREYAPTPPLTKARVRELSKH